MIEFYRVRTPEEARRKMKRRERRLEKKQAENLQKGAHTTDHLELLVVLRTSHRIRSFMLGKRKGEERDVLVSLNNNLVEVYKLVLSHSQPEEHEGHVSKKTKTMLDVSLDREQALELQGHRADVRCSMLSKDDSLLLSCGDGEVKLWDIASKQCIRTMKCGYALCCAFVPGDAHAVVGTKEGDLWVYHLGSGEVLRHVTDAHTKAVWSLDVRDDELCTGSGDNMVKFWDFGLLEEDNKLGLIHTKTLKMTEAVLCVKYSHSRQKDKVLLAVSLVDCTVKIFHRDSLAFFLSLYGHNLPVLCMSISDDDTLLATGSSDKNVKIWGLDFGDLHKSFFAHDATITSVAFAPRTHYLFSAGRDKRVRYWDCDRFEMILELVPHFGEVWSVVVSSDASFLISSGQERVFRVWKRTQDLVFTSEEKEKALEKILDEEKRDLTNPEVTGITLPTVISLEMRNASEEISDAIDVAQHERKHEGKKSANPLMLGKEPLAYVSHTLCSVKPSELEQALILLPFSLVPVLLFEYLLEMLEQAKQANVAAKSALLLLKIHFQQIVAGVNTQGHEWRPKLLRLRVALRESMQAKSELIGTNLAGLNMSRASLAQTSSIE